MIPELETFKQLMAEKAAAKELTMKALGEAKIAEWNGKDATKAWADVEKYGMSGVEGEKAAAMQKLADEIVDGHPDLFAMLRMYVPDGGDELVKIAGAFSAAGQEDQALLVTIFELASFERQEFGVTTRAKVRTR